MKKHLTKRRLAWGIGILAVLIVPGYFIFENSSGRGASTLRVERGTVTQTVKATGKTKAVRSVDLAFEKSGTIHAVYADAGDNVERGRALVALDTSELLAQQRENEADVETEQAKLAELRRGATAEDIAVQYTKLAKAEQDLANHYDSVPDVLQSAYTTADDAVRKQVSDFFQNAEELNPQLTFSIPDSQTKIDAETLRAAASQALNAWRTALKDVTAGTPPENLDAALDDGKNSLGTIRALMNRLGDALSGSVGLAPATLATYKAAATTARTNVNTAFTNVNSQAQTIAAQKITVRQLYDELNLKLAGAAPEAIAAQEATVRRVEAKLAATEAQLTKMTLRAPFAGVVTRQDGKVGAIASPNVSVVSLISRDALEIEAYIPEVDIGNINVGNPVSVTLDAFAGEHFSGAVAYIDPAETIVDGIVNFKIKIAFGKSDPRIKSGLTSNLSIETRKKEGVLMAPQSAVRETAGGAFVQIRDGNALRDIPVATGIRGSNGMVEIISGLSEGEEILNIAKVAP